MTGSAEQLISLLELERLDVDLFRGTQPETERQRVFGGQVAGQALIAAERTTSEEYGVHSLHSYFLRPGDPTVPIIYDVERMRDGRSFATRRVVARQHGRPIYLQTVSLHKDEPGLDHADPIPAVRPPEEGIPLVELYARSGAEISADDGLAWEREWAALDVRYLGNSDMGGVVPDNEDVTARTQLWVRVSGRIPDDPRLHRSAFTYASDLTLLAATLVPHGVTLASPGMQAASLDHTIWFHRPFRADEWWLYDQVAPSAVGGRGLALARVFAEDGRLVASVAQEGLIRYRPRS